MNQKKAVTELEKLLKDYHTRAKELEGKDYVAIPMAEHYSRMADAMGLAIRIVENRL